MKVLVVEDNERNAKLGRDVLSYAGHEVVVAGLLADQIEALRA
ncbi:response regulator [Solirubrobacter deserti]|uniref:Response regulatory domain-containing protein n=1 Tax=Solirubrobacter deserti TaxID=2282478 RepID=A0ABT4RKQ4_9ACTN|nr:hypothetical protein [Solirubrobacter deserti]MDA0139140.1 hypothetical protein [Solirubrobacter deserti]